MTAVEEFMSRCPYPKHGSLQDIKDYIAVVVQMIIVDLIIAQEKKANC